VANYTGPWENCTSSPKFKYSSTKKGSIYLYPDLIKSGIKILVYSGDCDTVVNYMGTMKWIHNLKEQEGLNESDPWHSWTLDE
jgi:cathepsin A (carboxypeptidase C)/serine carboxypeptidase-like clade 2